jgi:hypothetical protein
MCDNLCKFKSIRLEIFSLRSRESGPLAAWMWDRRGARMEANLRENLRQERRHGHQLLEVLAAQASGQERLHLLLKELESQHQIRYRIVSKTEASLAVGAEVITGISG